MDESRLLRVEVEIRLETEPISGLLRAADGREREFAGVLELIALLDEARDGRVILG